jgi:hypothetical protein
VLGPRAKRWCKLRLKAITKMNDLHQQTICINLGAQTVRHCAASLSLQWCCPIVGSVTCSLFRPSAWDPQWGHALDICTTRE